MSCVYLTHTTAHAAGRSIISTPALVSASELHITEAAKTIDDGQIEKWRQLGNSSYLPLPSLSKMVILISILTLANFSYANQRKM